MFLLVKIFLMNKIESHKLPLKYLNHLKKDSAYQKIF